MEMEDEESDDDEPVEIPLSPKSPQQVKSPVLSPITSPGRVRQFFFYILTSSYYCWTLIRIDISVQFHFLLWKQDINTVQWNFVLKYHLA